MMQVNYLEWEGKRLPESAWCSIPFNEVVLSFFKVSKVQLFFFYCIFLFHFKQYCQLSLFFSGFLSHVLQHFPAQEEFTSDSLYMMLASTLVYFFLPLLAVVFLYTRFSPLLKPFPHLILQDEDWILVFFIFILHPAPPHNNLHLQDRLGPAKKQDATLCGCLHQRRPVSCREVIDS